MAVELDKKVRLQPQNINPNPSESHFLTMSKEILFLELKACIVFQVVK